MAKIIFENGDFISESRVVVRCGKTPAGRSSSVNWHEHLEFLYCAEGRGTVFMDDRQYPMLPYTLFSVGSQVIHSVYAETDMHFYTIFINNDFFQMNGIDPSNIAFCEYSVADEELHEIVLRLAEAWQSTEFRQARLNRAATDFILYLCENLMVDAEKKKRQGRSWERTKEVIIYLKNNFQRSITLDDIAKEMNINKYQLSREFKQMTGVSIFDFLNSYRCKEAKKLLKAGSTVSEAANSCGFKNLSFFSKTYKKYIGVMPIETKRQSEK